MLTLTDYCAYILMIILKGVFIMAFTPNWIEWIMIELFRTDLDISQIYGLQLTNIILDVDLS